MDAPKGKQFLLTEKGYNLPSVSKRARAERAVGKPLKGFEQRVPKKWFDNGWVEISR